MCHVDGTMTFPSAGFRPRSEVPLSPRLRRIALGLLAAGFFVFFVMPALAGFATDWLWYDEIRFESVFLTSLIARGLLFVVTGVVAFAFLYGNIRWSRQRAGRVPTLYVNRVGAARSAAPRRAASTALRLVRHPAMDRRHGGAALFNDWAARGRELRRRARAARWHSSLGRRGRAGGGARGVRRVAREAALVRVPRRRWVRPRGDRLPRVGAGGGAEVRDRA